MKVYDKDGQEIDLATIEDINPLKKGAPCSYAKYQDSDKNALRIYLDTIIGTDKGMFIVSIKLNSGGNVFSLVYWYRNGNSLSANSYNLLEDTITVRYVAVDNGQMIIDLDNIQPYSFVGIWCPTGLKGVESISV